MSNEIKPFKPLGPAEMLETLAEIKDVQAEIVCHVKAWLHQPRPEVDERFTAARNREAAILEQTMAFDRRLWPKTAADEAELKAEALAKKRRKRAEAAAQSRYCDDQPEGESP